MNRKTVTTLLYCVSALLLVIGALLVVRQYVLIPGEYEAPELSAAPAATPAPAQTPGAEPTPAQTPGGDAEPSAEPEPTEHIKLAPERIYFTKYEVMADIFPVGRIEEGDRAGQMATIDDPDVAAWYEPGPAPGDEGNAIINGHKSWKGKAGRFSILWKMEVGDEVVIKFEDGSYRAFTVESASLYPYNEVPEEVMYLSSETPRMTLITCYGEFDNVVGTSKQRCVVVCVPSEFKQAEDMN